MTERLKTIITKTRVEQSLEIALLKETQGNLHRLKQRQEQLSLREAFIIGAGGIGSSDTVLTGRQISSAANYAEKKRSELQEISKESAVIERDSLNLSQKLVTIQTKLAVKSRLLDHLSKMK